MLALRSVVITSVLSLLTGLPLAAQEAYEKQFFVRIPSSDFVSEDAFVRFVGGSNVPARERDPAAFLDFSVKIASWSASSDGFLVKIDRFATEFLVGGVQCSSSDQCKIAPSSGEKRPSYLAVQRLDYAPNDYDSTVELIGFRSAEDAFQNSFPWKGTEGSFVLDRSNFVSYLAALRLQADLGFISTKPTVSRTLGDIRSNSEFLYETSEARRSLVDFAETVKSSPDQSYKSAILTVIVDVAAQAKIAREEVGVAGSEFTELVDSFISVSFDASTDVRYSVFPTKRMVDLVVEVQRWDLCLRLAQALEQKLTTVQESTPPGSVLLGEKGKLELARIVQTFTECSQEVYVSDPLSGPKASRDKVLEGSQFVADKYPRFVESFLRLSEIASGLGQRLTEVEKFSKEFRKHSGT